MTNRSMRTGHRRVIFACLTFPFLFLGSVAAGTLLGFRSLPLAAMPQNQDPSGVSVCEQDVCAGGWVDDEFCLRAATLHRCKWDAM